MSQRNKQELKAKLDRLRADQKNAKRRAQRLDLKLADTATTEGTAATQLKQGVANLLPKGYSLALESQLHSYQQRAVYETFRNFKTGVHTLNASAVGIGKTRVAASFCVTAQFKKVLWLTSKTLVGETPKELVGQLGLTVITLTDQNVNLVLEPSGLADKVLEATPGATLFFICNYETIKRWTVLRDVRWDCVVVDECTKLKGGAQARPSQIWQATKDLLQEHCPNAYRLFLSGTPAENRPDEVWAYLNIFFPEKFPNLYEFRAVFCHTDSYGRLTFSIDRLLDLLRGCVIRQTVKNLGLTGIPTLEDPEWFTQVNYDIVLDPESSVGQAYLQMKDDLYAMLTSNGVEHYITPQMKLDLMLRLRQLLTAGPKFTYNTGIYDHEGHKVGVEKHELALEGPFPKLQAAEDLISKFKSEGEQVVVFSCFNEPLFNLRDRLASQGELETMLDPDFTPYRVGILTGETSRDERTALITAFQQGELDVLAINKKAGAQGINLQKCEQWPGGSRTIIHLDRWWNPAIEEQANGRCVRSNSTEPVTAYYLHVRNSMDTYMEALIEAKKENVGQMDVGLLKESLERFNLGS